MKVHLETIYGFYHGQDPRTFEPDDESCTGEELKTHRIACEMAEKGEWTPDGSGCHIVPGMIVCSTTMGIGSYTIVIDENGEFVRDAKFEDLQQEGEWEEKGI